MKHISKTALLSLLCIFALSFSVQAQQTKDEKIKVEKVEKKATKEKPASIDSKQKPAQSEMKATTPAREEGQGRTKQAKVTKIQKETDIKSETERNEENVKEAREQIVKIKADLEKERVEKNMPQAEYEEKMKMISAMESVIDGMENNVKKAKTDSQK